MNRLPLSIAKKLSLLKAGGTLPGSQFNKTRLDVLKREGILEILTMGRTKTRVRLVSEEALGHFLQNGYHIDDLEAYVETLERKEVSGREAQHIASDTKLRTGRTFQGFLVNVNTPLKTRLDGEEFTVRPRPGTFTFIHDYEGFVPDKDVLVIGMENPENFRFVELQDHLFPIGDKLFVSRYPQSGDLVKWLQNLPNSYLHFGDFDLAGIDIFQREYLKKLEGKASFFIPPGIEKRIRDGGNRDLYNRQYVRYKNLNADDDRLQALIDVIHKYKKGLEQEAFIGKARLR